jgi:hypothetical protein
MLIKKLIDGAIIAAGSAAGLLVYYACKLLANIVNLRKPSFKISTDTKNKLKDLFTGMPLDNITIVYSAWLPAHIFNPSIEGMTFRNKIFIAHSFPFQHISSLLLLVHELVHIRQIRKLGEVVFACQYGAQFLRNRGYGIGMPLEKEAFEFVEKTKEQITLHIHLA